MRVFGLIVARVGFWIRAFPAEFPKAIENLPQRLKPVCILADSAAWLKPCPDTNLCVSESVRRRICF
jgi:hypothetical protein